MFQVSNDIQQLTKWPWEESQKFNEYVQNIGVFLDTAEIHTGVDSLSKNVTQSFLKELSDDGGNTSKKTPTSPKSPSKIPSSYPNSRKSLPKNPSPPLKSPPKIPTPPNSHLNERIPIRDLKKKVDEEEEVPHTEIFSSFDEDDVETKAQ
ncbi:unnamed protein product [Lactuca virosa]|uniref:Uncharacterized protein n=1 Tax=Lactuca virosa TaxID=75947 RepID=A0AAU9P0U3_9ASTR|nr:unnamed protein product [Lactuca virosa]